MNSKRSFKQPWALPGGKRPLEVFNQVFQQIFPQFSTHALNADEREVTLFGQTDGTEKECGFALSTNRLNIVTGQK